MPRPRRVFSYPSQESDEDDTNYLDRQKHHRQEPSTGPPRTTQMILSKPRAHARVDRETPPTPPPRITNGTRHDQDQEITSEEHCELPEDPSRSPSLSRLEALERENQELRRILYGDTATNIPIVKQTWTELYSIGDNVFLETPQWKQSGGGPVLYGSKPLQNVQFYLNQHPEIAFLFYRDYNSSPPKDLRKILSEDGVFDSPKPGAQSLNLVSEHIISAVEKVGKALPYFAELFPNFDPKKEIHAPYVFMYYILPLLPEAQLDLTPIENDLLNQLKDSITASHGSEYADAKACAARGVVTRRLMKYLIRPGDVLVCPKDSPPRAYIAASWAIGDGKLDTAIKERSYFKDDPEKRAMFLKNCEETYSWKVSVWSWVFDGSFEKKHSSINIHLRVADDADEFKVNCLNYFPLIFDTDGLRDLLNRRGKMFWKCREKKLISYQEEDHGILSSVSLL